MASGPESLQASAENTKTEYRQLGKSGLKVSMPIVGAMSFGSSKWADWVLDEAEALPLLKAAYDRGVNTWDTANAYSNGESEKVIAAAIKKYSIPRHKLIILTKCFFPVGEELNINGFQHAEQIAKSKDYVNQKGNPSLHGVGP